MLKSNAISVCSHGQTLGLGMGQVNRVDSVKQALERAEHFHPKRQHKVMASDAFFPFNDCVQLAHEAGIKAFIQPGGSIRDKDSIDYCVEHQLAMVITGLRHFKH